MARYTLFQTGPDDTSTYAECWGATGNSPGREIASADTLAGLIDAVDSLGHDNFWIRGVRGRNVAGSRRDFRRLSPVQRELRRRLV